MKNCTKGCLSGPAVSCAIAIAASFILVAPVVTMVAAIVAGIYVCVHSSFSGFKPCLQNLDQRLCHSTC